MNDRRGSRWIKLFGRAGSIALSTGALFALMVALITAIVLSCRMLLDQALRGEVELSGRAWLLVSVAGFFSVCALTVVVQRRRLMRRVVGPRDRICESLRQIRSGDLAFRLTLRRGDHLTEVVTELNLVLDWLNHAPPEGAVTGGDVVELEIDEPGFERHPELAPSGEATQ